MSGCCAPNDLWNNAKIESTATREDDLLALGHDEQHREEGERRGREYDTFRAEDPRHDAHDPGTERGHPHPECSREPGMAAVPGVARDPVAVLVTGLTMPPRSSRRGRAG